VPGQTGVARVVHLGADASPPDNVYRAGVDEPDPYAARRWQLGTRGRFWFDVVLATGLLLPVIAVAASGQPMSWVLLCIAEIAPLYVRRRYPVAVFVAVTAASALQWLLIDTPLWGQVAFPVATYSVARWRSARWGLAALAVGAIGAALAAHDWLRGYDEPITVGNYLAYFLTVATTVVAAWALGTLGRVRSAYVDTLVERSSRIEREAAQRVELAASEERARIAREMHDVVAHGLSVMVVQADGARYAAERDPAVATTTLATIADTGREALGEMRRLLGLLRSGEVTGTRPQPRLGDISVLVEQTRATGTDVRCTLPAPGTAVPDGVALTAYRVVQESLSNVRKHAGPAAAVSLTVQVADDLEVLVEDDGRGASSTDDGRGLGLVGMRERVAVHDGTLDAGPRPGGGYRVFARIPL
jgi:signal transduction histidine kinase